MLSSTRIRARRATAVWIASSTMLRNTNLEGTDNVPGQPSDCKRHSFRPSPFHHFSTGVKAKKATTSKILGSDDCDDNDCTPILQKV